MITEIVELRVKPGGVEKFAAAVDSSNPLFAHSPGFIDLELHQSIEEVFSIILLIKWDSVAHHMEMFRKSSEYVLWRAAIGEFFLRADRHRKMIELKRSTLP
jgi:heme-degrading monooxygenase HmoA